LEKIRKKKGSEKPKEGQKGEVEKPPKKEHEHEHVAAELSEMVHLKAVKFRGWEETKAKAKPWEMSSFAEGKVMKFYSKHPVEFADYNSRQLSRIYPKGLRIDSSNYNPVPAWLCGAQIVALNYQTGSEPMWLNDGKFLDNGGSGYVLKPPYLREKVTFNPEGKAKPVITLTITILSASQLPKVEGKESKDKGMVINPYVSVIIDGPSSDRRSFRTKTVKNNGFNPVFKNDFKIPLAYPEMDLISFLVHDADFVSSDNFIGQYVLPVTCLREGFRIITLKDKKSHPYANASLLIFSKISH